MNFESYASGSKGNFYTLSDGQTKILIECGIQFARIKAHMGFKLNNIDGVLISHQHGDHSKAARDVAKAGLDIYTSIETIEALELTGHRLHPIKSMVQFVIGTFIILPFELEHDVPNLGFLIQSVLTGKKMIYITDSFYCKYRFNGLSIIAIECNYSKPILLRNIESGAVNKAMKNRLLKSHFSLENVKTFLSANDLSKCESIYLLHLSDGNSDSKLFKDEIQRLTGIPTRIC